MISFDIKSLYTSIPLDKTIEIKLQRIYNRNEITTEISMKVTKELLLLCTREVVFALIAMEFINKVMVCPWNCV